MSVCWFVAAAADDDAGSLFFVHLDVLVAPGALDFGGRDLWCGSVPQRLTMLLRVSGVGNTRRKQFSMGLQYGSRTAEPSVSSSPPHLTAKWHS